MKKVACIFGIVVGVTAVILAIICFTRDSGSWVNSQSYGGDAYTGIQNAAARTANNILDLAEIVKFAGGSILLIFGLFSITYFVMKLFDKSSILTPHAEDSMIDELPDL